MGQAESGKNIDSIGEKLLRWLVASLVLGKKMAMEAKNYKRSAAATTMAPETPFTCWSVLMHDLSCQIVADSSASINWRLASLMVELHSSHGPLALQQITIRARSPTRYCFNIRSYPNP
jgi:hypothetical protein